MVAERLLNEIANNFTIVIGCVFLCILLSIYSKLIRRLIISLIAFYAFMFFSYLFGDAQIIEIPVDLVYLSREILINSLYLVQNGTIIVNFYIGRFNDKLFLFLLFYLYEYLNYIPWNYNITCVSVVQYIRIVKIHITYSFYQKVDNIKKYIVDIRQMTGVVRC